MKYHSKMDTEGIIAECKERRGECHYKCCTFTKNYIVLYPGEFESHHLEKYHIKIIDDDYWGGKKAVCDYHEGGAIVHNRICAHFHFKPLDCKSYPYFPFVDDNDNLRILKGRKCPLEVKDLKEHKKWFLGKWRDVLKNSEIKEWVKKVGLVGYGLLPEKYKL